VLETTIRKPFVFAALVAMLFVLALELGSPHLVGGGQISGATAGLIDGNQDTLPVELSDIGEPPGRGLSYLALVDIAVVYVIAQYAIAQLGLGRLHGRLIGIVTLIGSILTLLAAIVMLLVAIVEVMIMIGLFTAAPFGTIAYLVIWGGFPKSTAAALLTAMVMLQVVALILLVLAHPSFVRQKGLLIVSGLSLGLKLVLGFLHAVVPRPLVAIADDIGAIITAVVALILALFFLVFSVPSIVKALRVDRLL